MKKLKISFLSVLLSGAVFAQINVQTPPNSVIADENPFLDASGYDRFDNNIGKGLYFPQTDLTQWTFNTSSISRTKFKSGFNGMIVYNTVSGVVNASGTENASKGEKVEVTPGFYYFKNDEGNTRNGVSKGKWVRLADVDPDAKVNFWTLNGNAGTTEDNFIGTTDERPLVFKTNNIARLTIGENGGLIPENVGGEDFEFVLKVHGKAKFDQGLVTSASTYPDYVFDNYFTGTSEENPNYEFKKLDEVESFIKENNHLPGVTSIKELTKSENGYNVDNTQLSIQTLEKVEELYLHVIEQQKEIQALKAEIAELKK